MTEKNNKPEGPQESPMSGKIDYDEIRKLIALLEEKGLSVFELEIEGLKVKIGRNAPAPAAPIAVPSPAAPAPTLEGAAAAAEARIEAAAAAQGHHLIHSPMVGTFYRAPDPTAAPFVDIGDTVKKGQTLCIIEAMKLMNEIECEVDGIVKDVLVENGKPVEYGQRLFSIVPSA